MSNKIKDFLGDVYGQVKSGAEKLGTHIQNGVTKVANGLYSAFAPKANGESGSSGGTDGSSVDTGAGGTGASGGTGTTAPLMTYEEWSSQYGTLSENALNTTMKYLDDAKKTSYAESAALRAEMEQGADEERNRAMIDANASLERNRATYGSQAEAMSRMGLTGSGYSDYINSQAYATSRQEASAAKAQWNMTYREAAKLEAEANRAADAEYNKGVYQASSKYFDDTKDLLDKKFSYSEQYRKDQQAGFGNIYKMVSDGMSIEDAKAYAAANGITLSESMITALTSAETAYKNGVSASGFGAIYEMVSEGMSIEDAKAYAAANGITLTEPMITALMNAETAYNDGVIRTNATHVSNNIHGGKYKTREALENDMKNVYKIPEDSEVWDTLIKDFEDYGSDSGGSGNLGLDGDSGGGSGNLGLDGGSGGGSGNENVTYETMMLNLYKDNAFTYTVDYITKTNLTEQQKSNLIAKQQDIFLRSIDTALTSGNTATEIIENIKDGFSKDYITSETFYSAMRKMTDSAKDRYSSPNEAGSDKLNLREAITEKQIFKDLGIDVSAYNALTEKVPKGYNVMTYLNGFGKNRKTSIVNNLSHESIELKQGDIITEQELVEELNRIATGDWKKSPEIDSSVPSGNGGMVIAYGDAYLYTPNGWVIMYGEDLSEFVKSIYDTFEGKVGANDAPQNYYTA